MEKRLSVSDAARQLTSALGREVRPREITMLFYERIIPDTAAPIRNGRRRIDHSLLPCIAEALRRREGTQ